MATILVETPAALDFGLDTRLWTIEPGFGGICDIPAGIHLAYYRHDDTAPTRGRLYHLQEGDRVKWVWNSGEEAFEESASTDIKAGRALSRYKGEDGEEWQEWTFAIRNVKELPFLSSMSEMPFAALQLKAAAGLSGHRLTSSILDKSDTLEQAHSTLLSEMQVSFLAFLYLHSWSGWERWRDSVQLVCCSARFIHTNGQFVKQFIAAVMPCIALCDPEAMIDQTTGVNVLQRWLAMLISECMEDEQLSGAAGKLKDHLERRLGWCMDEAELCGEDEQPVLVKDQ